MLARAPRRLFVPGLVILAMLVAACGSSTPSPSSSAAVAGASGVPGASGLAASSASTPTMVPGGGGPGTSAPPTQSSPVAGAAGAGALALQAQMVSVIRKVNPSVVLIETSAGLGSGVVFDSRGDILTNAHVAGTSTSFKVSLSNGHSYSGKLVGSFTPDDVAVIRIAATGLSPATFGDSSQLQVGDVVLAMGNPLGLQSSVTQGIVSALGRNRE